MSWFLRVILLVTITLSVLGAIADEPLLQPATSSGCPTNPRPKSEIPELVEIAGRRVSIWYPPSYNDHNPIPVIIAFHDASQTIKDFSRATQLTNHTLNDFAIVVYPHRREFGWLSEENDGTESLTPPDMDSPTDDDFFWTTTLLDHLSENFCIDTSRQYVTGLGTGGGLTHLLACHPPISNRIAAFAMINPGLFKATTPFDQTSSSSSVWNHCEVQRARTPVLEVHSGANTRYKYYPKKSERGMKVTEWLSGWAERNSCGPVDGPVVPSADGDGEANFVTKLRGGQMSEGIGFGGTVTRVSYRCEAVSSVIDGAVDVRDISMSEQSDEDEGSTLPAWYAQTTPSWQPKPDRDDVGSLILHYHLQGLGHGWPRQGLTKLDKVVVDGREVEPPGEPWFDTTAILLDWLKGHRFGHGGGIDGLRGASGGGEIEEKITPVSTIYRGERTRDEL